MVSEETYATCVLLLVIDRLGSECLEWHPETVRRELEVEFQVQIPKVTLDKFMAATAIMTTNYFWKDALKFIELCNVLSGDDFDPTEFDPADSAEMLWGINEALIIYPPDEDSGDEFEFSPDVLAYIREELRAEGLVNPPDVLRVAIDETFGPHSPTFADDPEMFQAVYETQMGRSNDLLLSLAENLGELAEQISQLPLQEANPEAIAGLANRANQARQRVMAKLQES